MNVPHINGCDMACAEHGDGAALLLIHRSLCDLRYWAPQMEALGQSHRTIAPSLRHYWPARWDGASDDVTVHQHVECVFRRNQPPIPGSPALCVASGGGEAGCPSIRSTVTTGFPCRNASYR
jgi:pimeloyl-ACP methyl ester carboxylesterase